MYGTELRYNEILVLTNTIQKPKRIIYPDISNKYQHTLYHIEDLKQTTSTAARRTWKNKTSIGQNNSLGYAPFLKKKFVHVHCWPSSAKHNVKSPNFAWSGNGNPKNKLDKCPFGTQRCTHSLFYSQGVAYETVNTPSHSITFNKNYWFNRRLPQRYRPDLKAEILRVYCF